MDAQVLGLGVTLGSAIVGVTLYAAKARSTAESAMHKARNVESVHAVYIAHADAVFARKDVISVELNAIHGALEDIKNTLKDMRSGV